MPHTPRMNRSSWPSRSTYCRARKRTMAWPTVNRTVPTSPPCATDCRDGIIAPHPTSTLAEGRVMTGRGSRVTPRARPLDLAAAWNASDADVAARFHPVYERALGRLPQGRTVLRGLPFAFGTRSAPHRWLLV